MELIPRSFIHLPKVGPKRERAIWRAGIGDWEDFLAKGEHRLPKALYRLGRPVVEHSLTCLQGPRPGEELAGLFPAREHWRLAHDFKQRIFLDIETGGPGDEWGGVTIVGIYDGEKVEQYIANHNIWLVDDCMQSHIVVVTFAGTGFDLPVLKSVFSRLYVPPIHLDLMPALKRLGYSGGLKRIEKRVGLTRPPEVEGFTGYDAVLLWQRHLAGDPLALELLLTYNRSDIINLTPLTELALSDLSKRLFREL